MIGTYFASYLHAVAQLNSQLTDVSKGVLVCHSLINTEYFRRGVLHKIDGWQAERIGDFGGTDKRKVCALREKGGG
jgi:hypothetical protein